MSGATLDPLRDVRWKEFVDRVAGATIFHHPEWLRLIHDSYGLPVAACAVLDGKGSITAGFPVALVRIPFARSRLVAFRSPTHARR
jgi:hypothetical protein